MDRSLFGKLYSINPGEDVVPEDPEKMENHEQLEF
jgi:hypothetical protein